MATLKPYKKAFEYLYNLLVERVEAETTVNIDKRAMTVRYIDTSPKSIYIDVEGSFRLHLYCRPSNHTYIHDFKYVSRLDEDILDIADGVWTGTLAIREKDIHELMDFDDDNHVYMVPNKLCELFVNYIISLNNVLLLEDGTLLLLEDDSYLLLESGTR